jgi:hypothetical protein
MYYYWFSGRKLLEKPIDLLLENKNIDINFCLMWVNVSWSRIWVGSPEEELIKCEYREDDPEKFVDDLKKYTDDSRYIRIDGKPVIFIYQVTDRDCIQEVVRRWRKHAIEIGIGEIAVFSHCPVNVHEKNVFFDGNIDFCPAHYPGNIQQFENEQGDVICQRMKEYTDCLNDYRKIVGRSNNISYLSCMAGWDNSPRHKQLFRLYDLGFTMKSFYDMVRFITDDAILHKKEFIFAFAWNEWAEGAYLEPDKRYGYSILNTFTKAICGLPM